MCLIINQRCHLKERKELIGGHLTKDGKVTKKNLEKRQGNITYQNQRYIPFR